MVVRDIAYQLGHLYGGCAAEVVHHQAHYVKDLWYKVRPIYHFFLLVRYSNVISFFITKEVYEGKVSLCNLFLHFVLLCKWPWTDCTVLC